MSLQPQRERTYLSHVRETADALVSDDVVTALSKPERNSTKAWFIDEARSFPTSSLAEVLAVVASGPLMSETICIIENISPQYIEGIGSAWDIDSGFFVEHARNPLKENLWLPKDPEELLGWDPHDKSRNVPKNKLQWHIDGNFEYHGLNVQDNASLNSSPNYFKRYCFRSTWGGLETITSNTKISYCRVYKKLCLFLVDAPFILQKLYDDMSREFRPSLRLPYALNRGGLQLQPLFELREQRRIHYSLFESLKSAFMHEWQKSLVFTCYSGQTSMAVLPAPILCYLLSNSMYRTNLRYLSQEIRRISFQEIRYPDSGINQRLHDRREDLVAYLKAGLAETSLYIPTVVDEYVEGLQSRTGIFMNSARHNTTAAHQQTLEEALELEKFLMETFQLLMSSISVQDAKLGIEQSQLSNQQSLRATQLTILASIYVPLSFVTGVFGMNLRELNGSDLSIWVFFIGVVIAAIVTALIFLILQMHAKNAKEKMEQKKKSKNDNAVQEKSSSGSEGKTKVAPKFEGSMA